MCAGCVRLSAEGTLPRSPASLSESPSWPALWANEEAGEESLLTHRDRSLSTQARGPRVRSRGAPALPTPTCPLRSVIRHAFQSAGVAIPPVFPGSLLNRAPGLPSLPPVTLPACFPALLSSASRSHAQETLVAFVDCKLNTHEAPCPAPAPPDATDTRTQAGLGQPGTRGQGAAHRAQASGGIAASYRLIPT